MKETKMTNPVMLFRSIVGEEFIAQVLKEDDENITVLDPYHYQMGKDVEGNYAPNLAPLTHNAKDASSLYDGKGITLRKNAFMFICEPVEEAVQAHPLMVKQIKELFLKNEAEASK